MWSTRPGLIRLVSLKLRSFDPCWGGQLLRLLQVSVEMVFFSEVPRGRGQRALHIRCDASVPMMRPIQGASKRERPLSVVVH